MKACIRCGTHKSIIATKKKMTNKSNVYQFWYRLGDGKWICAKCEQIKPIFRLKAPKLSSRSLKKYAPDYSSVHANNNASPMAVGVASCEKCHSQGGQLYSCSNSLFRGIICNKCYDQIEKRISKTIKSVPINKSRDRINLLSRKVRSIELTKPWLLKLPLTG